MQVTRYADIPLDKLEIGPNQARTRGVEKNIDDLARSIKAVGLLEPIVVAPLGDDRYEIITGQRRFLACQRLGFEKVPAGILEIRPAGKFAKAISLTENMVRENMPTKDYIDACTELYRQYGSIKSVCEELGLPRAKVTEYVKFDQLVPSLKSRVEKGMDMKVALRAQKAATDEEGNINEEAALALADEMKGMSGVQQKQLEKLAAQQSNAPVEEIIEAGRRQPRVKQLVVTISEELDQALDDYAGDEETNRDDAAISLIEAGLTDRGYI